MDKTPIETWIEEWGTNLDWEAKEKLREAVRQEKMTELKVQISERPKGNKFNPKENVLSQDHLDSQELLGKQESLQQFHSDEPLDREQLHLYADSEAALEISQARTQNLLHPKGTFQCN